jgi:hypothetical protein
MKTDQEYIKDLSDIRNMMEKSTKFLSLAGWSGIMAGIYALAGACVIYSWFGLNVELFFLTSIPGQDISGDIFRIVAVGSVVLLLALATVIFLSYNKAQKNNEALWNITTRRLVLNMAIPLVAGGVLILILIDKGFYNLMAPLTLIFYGLSLVNASRFTFDELRYMGIMEIILGLLCTYLINFSLIFWAFGFGILHILYGIYMHWRYER